jgi:hypothetical protein
METYTIAAAARLVGTAKTTLYQAVRTGRLQATAGPEPGDVLTVTAAALQGAGFAVPLAALAPAPPSSPPPPEGTAAARATPVAAPPAESPAPPPGPEPALIAHLERALAQAQERELRLLDVLAQVTGPRRVPVVPAAAPSVAVTPAPRAAAPPPLQGLRQQIVTALRQHPEGLAPKAVQTLLQVDQDVRSTMKGMVRSGLLTRLAAGRYIVAGGAAQS